MTPRPVAIVTGAASGIGAATATELARRGVAVLIGYHPSDPHDPEKVAATIRKNGGMAALHPVDVRSSGEVDRFAARAHDEWGRIDHVIANAGILRRTAIADLTDEAWDEVVDTDLTGVMRTIRAAIPHFPPQGGSVVAISSVVGANYGWAEHAHYAAAKAGVLGLVQSFAQELGPRGVRVNAVVPGTIATPQSLDSVNSLGRAGVDRQGELLPLSKPGTPEDIANAVAFLSSTEAAFITGTSLLVDGGLGTICPR